MLSLSSKPKEASGCTEEPHVAPFFEETMAMGGILSQSQQTSGQAEKHCVASAEIKAMQVSMCPSQEEQHAVTVSKKRKAIQTLMSKSQQMSGHAEEHSMALVSREKKSIKMLISETKQTSGQAKDHHVVCTSTERKTMPICRFKSQQTSGHVEVHQVALGSKKRKATRILISKSQQTSDQVEEHHVVPASKEIKAMQTLIAHLQEEHHVASKEREALQTWMCKLQYTSGQADGHVAPLSKKRKALRITVSPSLQTSGQGKEQHVTPASKERKVAQIWVYKSQQTLEQADEHPEGAASKENKAIENQVALQCVETASAAMGNKSSRECELQNVEKARMVVSHSHKLKENYMICPSKGKLQEIYTLGAHLGRGGFGFVYEGIRNTDGLPPIRKRHLPMEVALMRHVNSVPASPHVLNLIEWFDFSTHYILVLERPESCQDLHQFCTAQGGTLTEVQARVVMLQVIEALRICHDRGVLHRDLKPQNLLIQPDTLEVKLIDFGCAVFLKDAPCAKISGTKLYFPPEVFLWKQYLPNPATVWSFGVTLYTLLFGHLPFTTIEDIIKCYLIIPVGISKECNSLIMQCLRPRATERPTLDQILLHPWFH